MATSHPQGRVPASSYTLTPFPALVTVSDRLEGWCAAPSTAKCPDQLWVSTVTAIQCKKLLLWLKLTTAHICERRHKHLEGNLTGTPCPFSKTTAVTSARGHWPPQPWAFDWLIGPGMNPLLVSGPQIRQLVTPGESCLYCTSRHILL